MPDLWMDVDVALSEVPVNIMPLIDDTTFKDIEDSVAYDAAGMDLVWNFTSTAGATTQTAVTPTTGGDYDWTNQGNGMYTIEIPDSGGASINNDTEGFGWFTGVATGILPWRSPTIGFRAAGINNVLIDSAYNSHRGLSGDALPDASADGLGGLPVSDAGGLDLDTQLGHLDADITSRLAPTTPGRTVDVAATGEVGIDLDNIHDASAPHTMSNITIPTVTTVGTCTTNTDMRGTDSAALAATALSNATWTDVRAGYLDNINNAALASISLDGANYVNARVKAMDDIDFTATQKTYGDANWATGGSDATSANQTTIINHLTDVKGTGFVKDTHSLPQCLTATSVTVSDKTGFSLAVDQSGVTIGTVNTCTTNTDMRGTDNAALAATALSTAQWTNVRAGYLDNINNAALASISVDGANYVNARVKALDDIDFTATMKAYGDANWATGGGGGDATEANQNTIITHLTQIKGTGFVMDTHSLPQCLTATTVLVSDKTGFSLAADQSGVTIGIVTSVTNGVTLANGAITSAVFDSATAYPLTSADAGATAVARTGADGDTLEDLSDEIDAAWVDLASMQNTMEDHLTDIKGTGFVTDTHSLPQCITATTVLVSDKTGFSLAADQSGVTIGTVNTCTTNTDMRGTDNAALAATALSSATWTAVRAGYLDNINNASLANISVDGSNHVNSRVKSSDDIDFTATQKAYGDANWATGGGGGDATAANQTAILTHLTQIKGTGFTMDVHSLPQCITATTVLVSDKTGFSLTPDQSGVTIGTVSLCSANTDMITSATVKAQVVAALSTDTYAEPGQESPAATTSLATKISYLYKFLRNKITNSGTQISVYNDAGDTVDHKATVSEADSTVTRDEFTTGA